jgi:hypothetical protein
MIHICAHLCWQKTWVNAASFFAKCHRVRSCAPGHNALEKVKKARPINGLYAMVSTRNLAVTFLGLSGRAKTTAAAPMMATAIIAIWINTAWID